MRSAIACFGRGFLATAAKASGILWTSIAPTGLLGGVGCQRIAEGMLGTTARCAEGLVALGPRCCAADQRLEAGRCVGRPQICPPGWELSDAIFPGGTAGSTRVAGCLRITGPVKVIAGRYVVGPNDWESEHVVAAEGEVGDFWLDSAEVTVARYRACIQAGRCRARLDLEDSRGEPGVPVVDVTAEEAEDFCAWSGGRLPSTAEWLLAATGPSSRRFPWGQTGLVCRRAAFGLVRGPCAEGGVSPDLAGARPDGKSELGLFDLVGNVAEIVKNVDGSYSVRGGSFRSDHASQLKTWSVMPYQGPRLDVGLRCAYDRQSAAAATATTL